MRGGKRGSGWSAAVLALVGALLGDAAGLLLAPVWRPLGQPLLALGSPSTRPWTLQLGIVGLSVGAWIRVNGVGLVGMAAGLWWYRRKR